MAYGYTCFVDLFPWPPPAGADPGSRPEQRWSHAHTESTSRGTTTLPPLASLISSLIPGPPNGPNAADTVAPNQSPNGLTVDLDLLHLPPPLALTRPPMSPVSDDGIAAIVDGVPIPENSNCTQALIGATFVSASSLHFEGKATLLFTFPVGVMMHRCLRAPSSLIFSFMQDLACNLDGTFLLRYRAMNLFGAALEADRDRLPIIAECWGGPAIVYPTKDFPGLTESTDLTKVSVSTEAMLVTILSGSCTVSLSVRSACEYSPGRA